jgi:hypothetical protein
MKKKYLPYILAGVFCLTLVIAYLWNDPILHYDGSMQVNHEKVGSLFTAIGAILTAATVFLLYQQLIVIRQEVKSKSLPLLSLVIPTGTFNKKELAIEATWAMCEDGQGRYGARIPYILRNIGPGVAYNIVVNFPDGKNEVTALGSNHEITLRMPRKFSADFGKRFLESADMVGLIGSFHFGIDISYEDDTKQRHQTLAFFASFSYSQGEEGKIEFYEVNEFSEDSDAKFDDLHHQQAPT